MRRWPVLLYVRVYTKREPINSQYIARSQASCAALADLVPASHVAVEVGQPPVTLGGGLLSSPNHFRSVGVNVSAGKGTSFLFFSLPPSLSYLGSRFGLLALQQ